MLGCDDTLFRGLYAAMSVKERIRALKGAFRREAAYVRKRAVANLRGSGLRTAPDMERGIRAVVMKDKGGFRVTIGTKRATKTQAARGFHTNRRGQSKPILIWAEAGTKKRATKSQTKWFTRSRKAHNTGAMPSYEFMNKTLGEVEGQVTARFHDEVIESITREAKKYGCI